MNGSVVNANVTKILVPALKWLVLALSYGFLAFKLYKFDQYDAFLNHFKNQAPLQYLLLIPVFVLWPVNIFLEVKKWQRLVAKSEMISFRKALKAVLAGFTTGFFTPNRVGEMAGRMVYMQPNNRKITAVYSLLNSFTQNYVVVLVGFPAAICFYLLTKSNYNGFGVEYAGIVTLFLIISTFSIFFIPRLVRLFNAKKWFLFLKDISDYNISDLLSVTGYSLIRYFVFSIQFFVVLRFFGVELSAVEALVSIPVSYLFVTFTPSLAFSEAAIRSSYAVVFIGAFSDNTAGIAIAGFLLWLINYGLPMVIGSRLVANTK